MLKFSRLTHFVWQHVKVNMMACEADDCTHRFCTYCLAVHLGIDTDAAASASLKGGAWHCPTCSSGCCCSQPECNKAHRHCKAFRYRCRRAAAANLRMSAAHALVSLGGLPASGKGKNKGAQALHAEEASNSARSKLYLVETKEIAPDASFERLSKRRDPSLPAGPADGAEEWDRHMRTGGACEDQPVGVVAPAAAYIGAQTSEDAGDCAVGVLASLCAGRSPSPAADQGGQETAAHDDGSWTDRVTRAVAPESTGRLEQLAMFALQSLAAAAMEQQPVTPRSPSQPTEQPLRELSDDAASVLDTPRNKSKSVA